MSIVLFVLGLLKYILIAILCVFALIIIFAVFIVLMPIRYDARLSYDNGLVMGAKVTWFFKIIKFAYSNNDETGRFKLSVFGKKLIGKKDKKAKSRRKKKKEKARGEKDINDFIKEESEPIDIQRERRNELKDKEIKVNADDDKPDVDIQHNEMFEKKEINDEPTGKKRRVRHTEDKAGQDEPEVSSEDSSVNNEDDKGGVVEGLKGILNKIKSFIDYPDKKLIINTTYKLIKRLISAGKPKVIELKAVIGFDDPYITGRAIGALAFISGMNGLNLSLQGNFTGPELKFAAEIKGKIVLFRFIWPLIIYVFTKPIWKIVKPIIFRKDESDE